MPQNCHSEERSNEESGAGLPDERVNPPPQTPRLARGDMLSDLLRQGPAEGVEVAKVVSLDGLGDTLAGSQEPATRIVAELVGFPAHTPELDPPT